MNPNNEYTSVQQNFGYFLLSYLMNHLMTVQIYLVRLVSLGTTGLNYLITCKVIKTGSTSTRHNSRILIMHWCITINDLNVIDSQGPFVCRMTRVTLILYIYRKILVVFLTLWHLSASFSPLRQNKLKNWSRSLKKKKKRWTCQKIFALQVICCKISVKVCDSSFIRTLLCTNVYIKALFLLLWLLYVQRSFDKAGGNL